MPKQTFKDKVIIITGSSMGIGYNLAGCLAERGAKIVLNARNAGRLEVARKSLEAKGYSVIEIAADIADPIQTKALIHKTIDHYGQLDVLVNNAGLSTEGTLGELSAEVFRKIVEVNLLGAVYTTQAALPHLRASRGSVLFIGSAAGIRGLPNYSAYSASKMALTAVAESLKIEEKNNGVHVGLAYVGFTENDPKKTILDARGDLIPQPKRDFIKAVPVDVVAMRLLNMLENRTHKRVFSHLGKLNAVVNRWAPGLGEYILSRNYWKKK